MDDYGRESLSTQRRASRVDRFIAPRDSLPEICRRMLWSSRYEKHNGEIWSTKYLQQKRYINFLDKAFDLAPLSVQPKDRESDDDWCWPCKPRKKSYLSTADNVLDLPTYSFATFPDLLDWSSDDILVAALGKSYHKWSWVTQSLIDQGITMYDIQCCKFDPSGKRLLLVRMLTRMLVVVLNEENLLLYAHYNFLIHVLIMPLGTHLRVEVHNEMSKCQFVHYCKCNIAMCTITAVDWSPTGNSFVTGCSRGTICAMSDKGCPTKSVALMDRATMVVRVSPDARYVAVAGVDKRTVWVLTWPDLSQTAFVTNYEFVKDLTWHPWQTALLGIAVLSTDNHSSVIIWDLHADKIRMEGVGRGAYSIDAIRFNHRTGELLLSLWSLDVNVPYPKCSELVVMSDFETVVDHWGEGRSGLNRVRTMVFSPDGTKLATATADEDLIIWNYLPTDYKKNTTRKSLTTIPQFLDICAYGFTIR